MQKRRRKTKKKQEGVRQRRWTNKEREGRKQKNEKKKNA